MNIEDTTKDQENPTQKIEQSGIKSWFSHHKTIMFIVMPWLLVLVLSIIIILLWSRGDHHRYQSIHQPRHFYYHTFPSDDIWYQYSRIQDQFDRLWREHDRITGHQFPGDIYSSSSSQVSTRVNFSSSGVTGDIRLSDGEKLDRLQKKFRDAGMMIEGVDSGFVFSGSLDSYNSIQPIQF